MITVICVVFVDRTGEYTVSLLVENVLSNASAKYRLFVLTHLCRPPTIQVLGQSSSVLQVPELCSCLNEKRCQ